MSTNSSLDKFEWNKRGGKALVKYLQTVGMKGHAKVTLNLLEFFRELDDNQSQNASSAREIQGWLQYKEHFDYRSIIQQA